MAMMSMGILSIAMEQDIELGVKSPTGEFKKQESEKEVKPNVLLVMLGFENESPNYKSIKTQLDSIPDAEYNPWLTKIGITSSNVPQAMQYKDAFLTALSLRQYNMAKSLSSEVRFWKAVLASGVSAALVFGYSLLSLIYASQKC
jgi:hypothetical protein